MSEAISHVVIADKFKQFSRNFFPGLLVVAPAPNHIDNSSKVEKVDAIERQRKPALNHQHLDSLRKLSNPLSDVALYSAGAVVSATLAGAFLGSIGGGAMAERFGRRRTIQLNAAPLMIGAAMR
jgi:MFS family permease